MVLKLTNLDSKIYSSEIEKFNSSIEKLAKLTLAISNIESTIDNLRWNLADLKRELESFNDMKNSYIEKIAKLENHIESRKSELDSEMIEVFHKIINEDKQTIIRYNKAIEQTNFLIEQNLQKQAMFVDERLSLQKKQSETESQMSEMSTNLQTKLGIDFFAELVSCVIKSGDLQSENNREFVKMLSINITSEDVAESE